MPLVDRFNRVTGLIIGAAQGAVSGSALGASLGMLGHWCRIKAETR